MTIEIITPDDFQRLRLKATTFYRRAREGRYRPVVRGAWVAAGVPDSIEVRAAACSRVMAPHQVLVDRTAAWLHGIDSFAWSERETVPSLEVYALRGHTRSRAAAVDGGVRDLSAADLCQVQGVRVTTPIRTAADLGCRLRRREAYATLNEFARDHGVIAPDLRRTLTRYRGRRGVVQLRELIERVEPRVESVRESWVLLALHDAGVPSPVPQHWIAIDGVATYRLDFAWVKARVCVEYDGADAHDRTEAQRAADEQRRGWLRSHGWTVIVVKAGDFEDRRLRRWIRHVEEALRPAYESRRW